MEPPGPLNVSETRRLGGHELGSETELLAQRDAGWLLHEQRVRSGVNRIAIDLFAEDHATGSLAPLEDDGRDVLASQLVGRRETRYPSTDDDRIYDHI